MSLNYYYPYCPLCRYPVVNRRINNSIHHLYDDFCKCECSTIQKVNDKLIFGCVNFNLKINNDDILLNVVNIIKRDDYLKIVQLVDAPLIEIAKDGINFIDIKNDNVFELFDQSIKDIKEYIKPTIEKYIKLQILN